MITTIDIVIPNENQKTFVVMAERLEYKELLFLYTIDSYINTKTKIPRSKVKTRKGILANPKQLEKIKRIATKNNAFVAIQSSQADRGIIDRHAADMIFSFENIQRKDFIHQRASGFNQIMATGMAENKMAIGVSLQNLISKSNPGQALGRVLQNISLAKKYAIPVIAASFARNPYEMRSPKDIASLCNVLNVNSNSLNELF